VKCCIFRHQLHLTRSGFETEQDIENLKHLAGMRMIKLSFDPDTLPTPAQFLRGSNSAKFGLSLAFEALQFRNEAMHLTANTAWGASMTDVCPPEIRYSYFPTSEICVGKMC